MEKKRYAHLFPGRLISTVQGSVLEWDVSRLEIEVANQVSAYFHREVTDWEEYHSELLTMSWALAMEVRGYGKVIVEVETDWFYPEVEPLANIHPTPTPELRFWGYNFVASKLPHSIPLSFKDPEHWREKPAA
jgi:hypothetical protein